MRSSKQKVLIQFFASLTCFFFLTNSVAWGQISAAFNPQKIEIVPFQVPPELGDIASSFSNTFVQAPEHPVLIHLQDAHSNYSAQQNASKILDHLIREQKIDLVFVEGAAGKLDAGNLRFIENAALNTKIADRLAKMGELTGSDLYLLNHPAGAEFIGIEKAELYRNEIEHLREIFRNESGIRSDLTQREKILERDLTRLGNKDLLSVLRILLRLEKKTKSMTAEIASLERLSRRHLGAEFLTYKNQRDFPNLLRLTRLRDEESKLDREKAEAEIIAIEKFSGIENLEESLKNPDTEPRFVLENLYASVRPKGFEFSKYPNFSKYAKCLIFERELNAESLFREIENLLVRLTASLARTDEEKKAVRHVQDFKLFSKLMLLELTREEWNLASSSGFSRYMRANKFATTNHALEFYRLAEEREAAFYQIIENTLKSKKASRAIVITGGFHAADLKQYFSGKASAFMVATPKVSEPSRENYVKTLLGRSPRDIDDSEAPGVPYAVPYAVAASLGVDVRQRRDLIEAIRTQEEGRLESVNDASSLGKLKPLTSMDAPYTELPVRALQMMDKEPVLVQKGRFSRMVTPEREPGTSWGYNFVGQKVVLDISRHEWLKNSNFKMMHLDAKAPFLKALFEESREELKKSEEYLAFYDPQFEGGLFAIGKKREVLGKGAKYTVYVDLVFPFGADLRHFEHVRKNYELLLISHEHRKSVKLDITIVPSEVSFPMPEIVKMGAVPQEALVLKPAGLKMVRRLALPIERGVKIDANNKGPEIAVLPVARNRMQAADREAFDQLMKASRFADGQENFSFIGVKESGIFAITPVKNTKDKFARTVFSFVSLGNDGVDSALKFLNRGGLSFLFSSNGLKPRDLKDPAIQTTGPGDMIMTVVPRESVEGIPTWVELQAVQIEGRSLGADNGEQPIGPEGVILEAGKEMLLRLGPEKDKAVENRYLYVTQGKVALLKVGADDGNIILYQSDAAMFRSNDLTRTERKLGLDDMKRAVSLWDDLSKIVPLKYPLGRRAGTFGEAFHINVKVTPTTSPAILRVLGNPPLGSVRRLYVKISKPGTYWREKRYDVIRENPHISRHMAITHKVEKDDEIAELGLEKFKDQEIFIQEPVVVLDDVIQELIVQQNAHEIAAQDGSLDSEQRKAHETAAKQKKENARRLIEQFVARITELWEQGIIDSDSKLNNWGINQEGRLVFHDFDFTYKIGEFKDMAIIGDAPDFDGLMSYLAVQRLIHREIYGDEKDPGVLVKALKNSKKYDDEALKEKVKKFRGEIGYSLNDLEELEQIGFLTGLTPEEKQELTRLVPKGSDLSKRQFNEIERLSREGAPAESDIQNGAKLFRLMMLVDKKMVFWLDQFTNKVVGAFVNMLAVNYDMLLNMYNKYPEKDLKAVSKELAELFMEKEQKIDLVRETLAEALSRNPDDDFRKLAELEDRDEETWVKPIFRFFYNVIRAKRMAIADRLRDVPDMKAITEAEQEDSKTLWDEKYESPYLDWDDAKRPFFINEFTGLGDFLRGNGEISDEGLLDFDESSHFRFPEDWGFYDLDFGILEQIDALGLVAFRNTFSLAGLKHVIVGSAVPPAYGIQINDTQIRPIHLIVANDQDGEGRQILRIIDVAALETQGKESGTVILNEEKRGKFEIFKRKVAKGMTSFRLIEGEAIWEAESEAMTEQEAGGKTAAFAIEDQPGTKNAARKTLIIGGREITQDEAERTMQLEMQGNFVPPDEEPTQRLGGSRELRNFPRRGIGNSSAIGNTDVLNRGVQGLVLRQGRLAKGDPSRTERYKPAEPERVAPRDEFKTQVVAAPKPETPSQKPGVVDVQPLLERQAGMEKEPPSRRVARVPQPEKPAPVQPVEKTDSKRTESRKLPRESGDSGRVDRPQKPPEIISWQEVKVRLEKIKQNLMHVPKGIERMQLFGRAILELEGNVFENGLTEKEFKYSATRTRIYITYPKPVFIADAKTPIYELGFVIAGDKLQTLYGSPWKDPGDSSGKVKWRTAKKEDGQWVISETKSDSGMGGVGASLGTRTENEEIIIQVALEGMDRLLYPGDLGRANRLERLFAADKPAVSGPPLEVPLEFLLGRINQKLLQRGHIPADFESALEKKRRSMVVTQELVEKAGIREAILENISKVYLARNSFNDPIASYDQFVKEARLRGIEITPIVSVSGIRPEDLERKLRKSAESFSAQSADDSISIPAINKDHFARFKIDENAIQRGNVSMKLAMEVIMALALVDDPDVYKAAGFKKPSGDDYWHVDNSFVAFVNALAVEYKAQQLREQAA